MNPVNNPLNKLVEEYREWNKSQGLNLGSADEHLHDESLTEAQRAWLRDFSNRWDQVQREPYLTFNNLELGIQIELEDITDALRHAIRDINTQLQNSCDYAQIESLRRRRDRFSELLKTIQDRYTENLL